MLTKLLVADDSVTIQKVIKLALSSEGYDILAVSDGTEALKAIENEKPSVVLIDVALPDGDAYFIKTQINKKAHLASTKFILLASAFEKVNEGLVNDLGFFAKLVKPFDPSHLRKEIVRAINSNDSSAVIGKHVEETPPPPVEEVTTFTQPSFTPPAPPTFNPAGLTVSPPPFAPPTPVIGIDEKIDLPPVIDMLPTVEDPTPIPILAQDFSGITPNTQFVEEDDDDNDNDDDSDERESSQQIQMETDIKNLTESTIKMSGLDEISDMQWSLDDSKNLKESYSPPPTESIDLELNEPNEIPITVARPTPTTTKQIFDDGGSSFLKNTNTKITAAVAKNIKADLSNNSMAASTDQLEELVRKNVQAELQKYVQDIVPKIAETIIRKEIEKILSEP